MMRQTYELINLKKLENNIKTIVNSSKEYKYHIAVVKANCYGLGINCVKSILLGGANYLAVSSLDEALKVRKITNTRILVLEPIDTKYINIANKNNITLTISSLEYLNKVKNKSFTCHLKINTGMNRLGIGTKEELNEIYKIINKSNIKIEGIYTHIYKSTDSTLTENQFKRFENITSDIDLSKIEIVHIPNSDSKYLLSDEALIEDVNYISDKHPTFATAKFRYRSEDVPVTIEYLENNQIKVKYVDGKAVTPGQACVVYLGEQCIMGGIIKQVFKDGKDIWYLK